MMEDRGARNLLTVEEADCRPRANSDPTVNAGGLLLPEIRVEDCTDPELLQHLPSTTLPFGDDDPPRQRSNTCPEDLFRKRNGRPPTPPPGTFRKGHKFRSGFGKPVMKKEPVSFAHHRLTKLAESEDAEDPHRITEGGEDGGDTPSPCSDGEAGVHRLQSGVNSLHLESQQVCKRDTYPHASPEESASCTTEDSFVSQSQPAKCRCPQSSASAVDSKQLQAC